MIFNAVKSSANRLRAIIVGFTTLRWFKYVFVLLRVIYMHLKWELDRSGSWESTPLRCWGFTNFGQLNLSKWVTQSAWMNGSNMGIQPAKMEDPTTFKAVLAGADGVPFFFLWHFEWRKKHGIRGALDFQFDTRIGAFLWAAWRCWPAGILERWADLEIFRMESDKCWPDSSPSSPLYFTSSWESDQPHVFWPRHRGICFFWVPKSTQRRTPLNAFLLRTRVARMPSRQKHVYTYGLW